METSLHRQLKEFYRGPDARVEVKLGRSRIDVVTPERLIEIQHGSLAAIRAKTAALVAEHEVLVVKPLIAAKRIVTLKRRGGRVARQRMSPKRATFADAFHDLIYFAKVFPHPRLAVELLLVEVEETRYPGHGRRRRWRRDDFEIEDQKLVSVLDQRTIRMAADLRTLLAAVPPGPFYTGDLAEAADIPRWVAQRVAYCLRETGAARVAARRRQGFVYEWAEPVKQRRPRRAA
jgi:hypothetical protein